MYRVAILTFDISTLGYGFNVFWTTQNQLLGNVIALLDVPLKAHR